MRFVLIEQTVYVLVEGVAIEKYTIHDYMALVRGGSLINTSGRLK